jgi:hypothetical protein
VTAELSEHIAVMSYTRLRSSSQTSFSHRNATIGSARARHRTGNRWPNNTLRLSLYVLVATSTFPSRLTSA